MKYGIVLGASSGVGAEIAKALVQYGRDERKVIGFHRGNHPKDAAAVASCPEIELREGDAGSDYLEAQALWEGTHDLPLNSVDVLVHSLSGASIGRAVDMAPQRVEKTFNQLAHSLVWWVRWLRISGSLGRGARVIALSNPCPDFYLQGGGVIGPAKAALESYVRVLAAELNPICGVTVNCLRFSTVVTPALEKVMPSAIERLTELHKSIVPMGRMQTASDVANLVKMLLTPEASWINGAIIDGTGGAPMMLMNHAFHGKR